MILVDGLMFGFYQYLDYWIKFDFYINLRQKFTIQDFW